MATPPLLTIEEVDAKLDSWADEPDRFSGRIKRWARRLNREARSLELSTVARAQAGRGPEGVRPFDRERLTVGVGLGLARREAERIVDLEPHRSAPPFMEARAGSTPVDRGDP